MKIDRMPGPVYYNALQRHGLSQHRRVLLSTQSLPLFLEMARAYESDGITFFAVRRSCQCTCRFLLWVWLAAFWLVIRTACDYDQPAMCPFSGPSGDTPAHRSEQNLKRKTYRYAHLLDTALSSVKCASEPATISHDFAERIFSIAAVYAGHGDYLLNARLT